MDEAIVIRSLTWVIQGLAGVVLGWFLASRDIVREWVMSKWMAHRARVQYRSLRAILVKEGAWEALGKVQRTFTHSATNITVVRPGSRRDEIENRVRTELSLIARGKPAEDFSKLLNDIRVEAQSTHGLCESVPIRHVYFPVRRAGFAVISGENPVAPGVGEDGTELKIEALGPEHCDFRRIQSAPYVEPVVPDPDKLSPGVHTFLVVVRGTRGVVVFHAYFEVRISMPVFDKRDSASATTGGEA